MEHPLAPPIDFPLEEVKRRIKSVQSVSGIFIESALKLQKDLKTFSFSTEIEERDQIHKADEMMGKFIVEYLRQNFPSDSILSEDHYKHEGNNSFRWVLDPIDGSMNFVRGIPLYCVSIGLEHRESPVAGVVFAPGLSTKYSAILSQGAFKNGLRIDVSNTESLARAMLVPSFPTNRKEILNEVISDITAFISCGRSMRRTGSFVLDTCWVAEGLLDGIWEKGVKLWDTAASSVILMEAGGKLTDFNGKHFLSGNSEVVVSNGKVHSQIVDIMRNVRDSIGRN
ncbi:inositol monophosphatase family protein [Leptospira interrogans]|uniref:Inositol-1-monophosphatase n=20 Tax=Leptospira interrogans TaxID=173 RepID=Q8FA04_LEPIN|nr:MULTISPECIES: inositol monophosphatase family protein [Leptospira]APH40048.1 Inositol monophosphatase family protein [Leptospira interrogans serovar Copenhageni/Icterohaemorrhagiae]EMF42094.1 inositol monophosphatase family protein [Leptospira interrogans serovar Lora str. TE 1992]EMF72585.1 inositol monophosphatase family protein [Leptospira interrogans serovar Canicola str. LT1962]EMG08491.1 inositol monophosphatase family protein [Leptospira interrogans serovar Grippotyphosa str. LT2186]